MNEILLGTDGLNLNQLAAIARFGARVGLTLESINAIVKARDVVDSWIREGKIIYGITTGFGALSDRIISAADTSQLQQNILMSHAAGVGDALDEATVRAVIALRVNDMARGNSGIGLEAVELLIELLNRGVCPVVPEKGSVGASGDLAPLAHLALV
ncbi:MAG: aromatic amino acid lyase, partial [Methylococcaceae bacterium]|nr:aromatic amino acid lyase [Methylococcaceae bacterium]